MNIQEIANNEERFTEEINRMCREHKMSYIEAITIFCEENEMDFQDIPSLLGSTMKEQLMMEAKERKMMKDNVNKSKLF